MDLAGLLIAGAALLISLWTRVESYQSLRTQSRVVLVRRLGEALVHALEARSLLSDALLPRILAMQSSGNEFKSEAEEKYCAKLGRKHSESWELVKQSQNLLRAAASDNRLKIDPVEIEGVIALLNEFKHEAREALRREMEP